MMLLGEWVRKENCCFLAGVLRLEKTGWFRCWNGRANWFLFYGVIVNAMF